MSYKIVFIDDVVGRKIVRKFLDSCNDLLVVKILRQLQYLEEFGIARENPHLKKLTNTPFWEIRILGKHNVRILCSNYLKSQIIVVHIFEKHTNKTPRQEIDKATKLLTQALDI